MKHLAMTWSVMLALAVNAVIAALLFLLIPPEERASVSRTAGKILLIKI